jgi:hypothetical protein
MTERNIAGVYKPAKDSPTRLFLKEDKSFELALLDPRRDTVCFPGIGSINLSTSGTWSLTNKDKLVLTAGNQPAQPATVNDSISRFTNISSFNFWNRYGEPLPIRYILIPPARPKPHYGNSLYFFAQDFTSSDTLQFYFDGYAPVSYPGTIPAAIGNNIHKITVTEAYQPGTLSGTTLIAQKNKLLDNSNRVILEKRKAKNNP